MEQEHINRIKQHIQIIEESRDTIVDRWVNDASVVEILSSHEIDKTYFTFTYAHKVLAYYIDVVNGEQEIGNCPVIKNLLEFFHDKNISSAELFMICIHFRESLAEEFFNRDMMNIQLYKSVCYVFNANLKGVLEYYTETITSALKEKEHFSQLSNTDYLTQTNNRQHFDKLFKQELHRSKRYENNLAIILLDIDHFKDVNDVYGHAIGDKVLIELASFIKSHLRTEDIFARWGGEEFVILLPQTQLNNATKKAKNLCNLVAKHSFPDVTKITCSFGVTDLKKGDSTESIFKRVDQLLYNAKEDGRNQVKSN
jgi:diguanylate cyclase (GGDEF)-like protein